MRPKQPVGEIRDLPLQRVDLCREPRCLVRRIGGALPLGGGLWLHGSAGFDNVQLSSEPMDGCIFGAGSVALFQLRAGLSYRFAIPR